MRPEGSSSILPHAIFIELQQYLLRSSIRFFVCLATVEVFTLAALQMPGPLQR